MSREGFKKAVVGAAVVLGLSASGARAIDIMPGDYTVLPKGTNLFLLYQQYTQASNLRVDGVGRIANSELTTLVTIPRYLHYSEIAGVPVAYQVFLPVAAIPNARIGGINQRTAEGIGDFTAGFTFWPIHTKGTYSTTLGITTYVVAPTGAYNNQAGVVNVGTGAWALMPQVGLIQGLSEHLLLDVAVDVNMRQDNTEFGIRRSREASTQTQAYLRYKVTDTTSVSFGYSGYFGGKDYTNGIYAGTKTRTDQIRGFISHFFDPTFQIQAQLGADLYTQSGFKQDFNGVIRFLKVF